jgi:tetratricopeptide (TPR) repeat protein
VPIASERRFLEWAGRAVPDDEARTYSRDQIASLSRLPLEVVEQLAAFGLIDDREGRYRFRDLAAARQLADLLSAGVALSTVTRSLHEIRKWLPDAALSNMRLYPAAADAVLFEHMKGRCDRSGQFILPVAQQFEDPDAIFEEAQSAEEGGDIEAAARLYRRIMRIDPKDPAAAFNMGNLLRGSGRRTEVEAAYRAATKADSSFAEAWYNLADVLDDAGRCEEAVVCLERALDADPDYVDAIFNLGLLQQRKERYGAAAVLWQRYLALDSGSSWAAKAKQALKYCEMQFVKSPHR